MSLPSDGVNANALAETTTIPTGKKLIFLDPDTNEGGIITLENLTKQILSNLTSQTFNLDQGTKTLPAALNELNSKVLPKRLSISYNEGFSGDIVAIQYGKILHISGYIASEQSGSQIASALISEVQLFVNTIQLIFQTDDKRICTFGILTKNGNIIIGPCEKNIYRINTTAIIK